MQDLPAFAAWRLAGASDGFEVVYVDGRRFSGHSSAVEDGQPYAVRWELELDERWHARELRVATESLRGRRERHLVSAGDGRWTVDGEHDPTLDGLLDVDLECSGCTNAFPVRRLSPGGEESTSAPAVFVRALDLSLERLEQTYRRIDEHRYDYASGDFTTVLTYDDAGLVVDYPGIASRFA